MSINGNTTYNSYLSNYQTLYVNPYVVINNKEYTKHFYIENQRIVSKLGGGFDMDTVDLFSQVYGFQRQSSSDYNDKMLSNQDMVQRDIDQSGQYGTFAMSTGLYHFLYAQPTRNDREEEIFYYHSDHLGSTSYVTDITGMPSQHLDYLPFGEVLLEEKTQSWVTPYKFNCKELDDESGLFYYGARYYDAKSCLWLGVDPLSDKNPNESPFVYCKNNPIIMIDPDGMDWFENELTGAVYYNSNMSKGSEGKGAMKGEGWKHMGANGMFDKESSNPGSEIQLIAQNGGKISNFKDSKTGKEGVQGELMLGQDKANSFMTKQGYSFVPKDYSYLTDITTYMLPEGDGNIELPSDNSSIIDIKTRQYVPNDGVIKNTLIKSSNVSTTSNFQTMSNREYGNSIRHDYYTPGLKIPINLIGNGLKTVVNWQGVGEAIYNKIKKK
jgi:RHS repeat-associated protein